MNPRSLANFPNLCSSWGTHAGGNLALVSLLLTAVLARPVGAGAQGNATVVGNQTSAVNQTTPSAGIQTTAASQTAVVNQSAAVPLKGGPMLRLDLMTAYQTAIDNSVGLSQLRSNVLENKARIQEALSAGRPHVELDNAFIHNYPQVHSASGWITPPDEYDMNLVLAQNIFSFGRLHWTRAAAELTTKSAQENYRQQAEQLFSDVAGAFLDAILAQDNVIISQRQLEAQEAALRDAQNLYRAGTVAKFDILRIVSEVSRVNQTLITARVNVTIAKDRLLTALGLRVGTPIELIPVPMLGAPPDNLDGATDQALRLRPELGAITWAWEAAKAQIKVAASQDRPSLDFRGTALQHTSTAFDPAFEATAGLYFSVPLYDGGLTTARKAEAVHVAEQISQQVEGIRRNIRLEVSTAYNILQTLWKQLTVARLNVEQAAEALRVARIRYRSGVSTNVELLSAEAAFAVAEYGLAQAEHDYKAGWANWRRVISDEYPVNIPGPLLRQRAGAPAVPGRPFPPTTDQKVILPTQK